MPKRFLISRAALAWPFVILAFSFSLHAPLTAHPALSIKPLKVWSGIVSWYGADFHGRLTASGQPYDMFALTAAHPSLPFGSIVRLVNVRNGHSQVVRINDRGPFVNEREMDVSYLVAARLGLLDRGVGRIRMELLKEPQR
jgi:rare lipoprotein A